MNLGQNALGDELFDRTDYIIDIEDQKRRAVLHQSGGADVLYFAQPRIERLNDQLPLAKELVHDQSVSNRAIADDHHRQFLQIARSSLALQDLVGGEQSHLLISKKKIMAPFKSLHLVACELERARNLCQRNRVRLSGNFNQQRAQYRER